LDEGGAFGVFLFFVRVVFVYDHFYIRFFFFFFDGKFVLFWFYKEWYIIYNVLWFVCC